MRPSLRYLDASLADRCAERWNDCESLETATESDAFTDGLTYHKHGGGWILDLIADGEAIELLRRCREVLYADFERQQEAADAEAWNELTEREKRHQRWLHSAH